MVSFFQMLDEVNERIYKPNGLTLTAAREEAQNSDYGGGVFRLNARSVRLRVAKITPRKAGQFVVFWEKDESGKNAAYSPDTATDLLVVHAFADTKGCSGQFVFPKDALVNQNILKTAATPGKMATRVYPSWDTPVSKQAMSTQAWQLPYFINLNDNDHSRIQRLIGLYTG
ncbi:MepB family protein [Cohnella sp. GCM10012308]|uniref:MepB family protein n=1 Tax=Cohnella sp. GCM10012308 TaxID=3317329 RepID=UPI003619FFFA